MELELTDEIKCIHCGYEIKNSLNEVFNKEIVYVGDDIADYECPECLKTFNIEVTNLELGSPIEDNAEDYGYELEGFTIIEHTD